MYGFGDDIRQWVNAFFSDRKAMVLLRGTLTDIIFHEQGVPQGDIISPYIFILAVEILLIKINFTNNLKGITYGSTESRSETFADDTTIFIERKEIYLENVLKYLEQFSMISGLHCNVDKTRVIQIGNHD